MLLLLLRRFCVDLQEQRQLDSTRTHIKCKLARTRSRLAAGRCDWSSGSTLDEPKQQQQQQRLHPAHRVMDGLARRARA